MTDKNVNSYEYITKSGGTVTIKGYLQDKVVSQNGMNSIINIDFNFVECKEFEKTYTILDV